MDDAVKTKKNKKPRVLAKRIGAFGLGVGLIVDFHWQPIWVRNF